MLSSHYRKKRTINPGTQHEAYSVMRSNLSKQTGVSKHYNQTKGNIREESLVQCGSSNVSSENTNNVLRKKNEKQAIVPVPKLGRWTARLEGSKFRTINQRLYTSTGEDGLKFFRENPKLFEEYHQGFRQQLSHWPIDPLDVVIRWIQEVPQNNIIGDFGCGDGRIATTLTKNKVHSFDLVSTRPHVISCNIAKVPLDAKSLDIAVFCLSLMGTDWPAYLLEAWRCLKKSGRLLIAEVNSRITDKEKFVSLISSVGFELEKEEEILSFFLILKFKKYVPIKQNLKNSALHHESKKEKSKKQQGAHLNKLIDKESGSVDHSSLLLHHSILKPCLYKKR